MQCIYLCNNTHPNYTNQHIPDSCQNLYARFELFVTVWKGTCYAPTYVWHWPKECRILSSICDMGKTQRQWLSISVVVAVDGGSPTTPKWCPWPWPWLDLENEITVQGGGAGCAVHFGGAWSPPHNLPLAHSWCMAAIHMAPHILVIGGLLVLHLAAKTPRRHIAYCYENCVRLSVHL